MVCVVSLTACAEKVYSADKIFSDWQQSGDKASSFVEIQKLCAADVDKGHKDSTVCKVSREVELKIGHKKNTDFMKSFSNK